MNYIKVRPFFVKSKKKLVNNQFKLFKNIKVYLIFYLLLLKLTD